MSYSNYSMYGTVSKGQVVCSYINVFLQLAFHSV